MYLVKIEYGYNYEAPIGNYVARTNSLDKAQELVDKYNASWETNKVLSEKIDKEQEAIEDRLYDIYSEKYGSDWAFNESLLDRYEEEMIKYSNELALKLDPLTADILNHADWFSCSIVDLSSIPEI